MKILLSFGKHIGLEFVFTFKLYVANSIFSMAVCPNQVETKNELEIILKFRMILIELGSYDKI